MTESRHLSERERQIATLGSWHQVGHVIYALCELRVPDHLAGGPRTAGELAALTGTDPGALYRVLRCAGAAGIVAEDEKRRFTLTSLGDGLRSDRLGGLRPMVLFSLADFVRRPYSMIVESVRTGRPAFEQVFGLPFYAYLREHPEAGAFFDGFMAHWSRQLSERFAERLGLGRFARVADIGGGDGYFLAKALARHPGLKGELFELPEVAGRAERTLLESGVRDRVTVTAGDFFADPLPLGCDAYVLKSILHDWPDERAGAILGAVAAAMGDHDARLLIVDQIVPPLNQWDHSKIIDIDMLVLFGGKERDLSEWRTLLSAAGFELVAEPGVSGWTVLECRRMGDREPS